MERLSDLVGPQVRVLFTHRTLVIKDGQQVEVVELACWKISSARHSSGEMSAIQLTVQVGLTQQYVWIPNLHATKVFTESFADNFRGWADFTFKRGQERLQVTGFRFGDVIYPVYGNQDDAALAFKEERQTTRDHNIPQ